VAAVGVCHDGGGLGSFDLGGGVRQNCGRCPASLPPLTMPGSVVSTLAWATCCLPAFLISVIGFCGIFDIGRSDPCRKEAAAASIPDQRADSGWGPQISGRAFTGRLFRSRAVFFRAVGGKLLTQARRHRRRGLIRPWGLAIAAFWR